MNHKFDERQRIQKTEIRKINKHVLKLIQDKLVPLNKDRYEHLLKVNMTMKSPKKEPEKKKIELPPLLIVYSPSKRVIKSPENNRISIKRFSKTKSSNDMNDLLISTLKRLKDKRTKSGCDIQEETLKRCESLRSSVLTHSQHKLQKKSSLCPSVNVVRQHQSQEKIQEIKKPKHKQYKYRNYEELTQKVQNYLRVKKHELKIKFSQDEEQISSHRRKKHNSTQIQILLKDLKEEKDARKFKINSSRKGSADESLCNQLLKDIRQNMMEQKMNRIRKQINHKKIISMR